MLHSIYDKNKHRGPSSSEEFNLQVKETRQDVETLYSLLNVNEKKIYENTDIVLNENFQLQKRINELEAEVQKIHQLVELESEERISYSNFYNSSNINLNTNEPVLIDSEYGVAMPRPSSITNKLSHLTSTGRTVIPQDLEIVIEVENSKEFRST